MADLARSVAAPRSIDDVLNGVTSSAVELLTGADTAGVLLVSKGGNFESLSGTSELIYKLDRLQEQFKEGPCLDAAVNELVVRTEDFQTESRWPQYSQARLRTRRTQQHLLQALHRRTDRGGAERLF